MMNMMKEFNKEQMNQKERLMLLGKIFWNI